MNYLNQQTIYISAETPKKINKKRRGWLLVLNSLKVKKNQGFTSSKFENIFLQQQLSVGIRDRLVRFFCVIFLKSLFLL